MIPPNDPFGFELRRAARRPEPAVVVAYPGQVVRIVVAADPLENAGLSGGRASVRIGDSNPSPSGRGDSSPSPKGRGDSSPSPRGKGDEIARDPFGFQRVRTHAGGNLVKIIASVGQEIEIVVPEH